jgi:hypothetical protein
MSRVADSEHQILPVVVQTPEKISENNLPDPCVSNPGCLYPGFRILIFYPRSLLRQQKGDKKLVTFL